MNKIIGLRPLLLGGVAFLLVAIGDLMTTSFSSFAFYFVAVLIGAWGLVESLLLAVHLGSRKGVKVDAEA